MPTIPEILLGLSPAGRERLLRVMPDHQVIASNRAFPIWAHSGQLAPEGDWRTWVLMAGRGFGKTRAGAEWVLEAVRAHGRGHGQAAHGQAHPRPLPQAGGGRRSPSRLREGRLCGSRWWRRRWTRRGG